MIKKPIENCFKLFCDLDFDLNSFLNRTKITIFIPLYTKFGVYRKEKWCFHYLREILELSYFPNEGTII